MKCVILIRYYPHDGAQLPAEVGIPERVDVQASLAPPMEQQRYPSFKCSA